MLIFAVSVADIIIWSYLAYRALVRPNADHHDLNARRVLDCLVLILVIGLTFTSIEYLGIRTGMVYIRGVLILLRFAAFTVGLARVWSVLAQDAEQRKRVTTK
jgi:hypothetical protein